jgi:two-component system, cell cycle response regulator
MMDLNKNIGKNEIAGGTIAAFLNEKNKVVYLLKKLHDEGANIIVESCRKFAADTQQNCLDFLNDNNPNLIIIENDENNNGIILFENIMSNEIAYNVPVVFFAIEDKEKHLKVLELGALDSFNDYSLESYVKIKNYIRIGKRIVNKNNLDKLTGVYTKQYGESIIRKSIAIAKDQNEMFSILLVSIDDMGNIFKKLGKGTGNEILKKCVDKLKGRMSIKDLIYRYRDYEFVITFRDKTIYEILDTALKMQEDVQQLSKDYNHNISFSGGISSLSFNAKDYEGLIAQAVETVNAAKGSGTGKVYIYETTINQDNSYRILVVEENEVIRRNLALRYKNKGYNVYEAEEFQDALTILKDNKIDVIIIEFLAFSFIWNEVKTYKNEINRNTKIIVLAAHKNEDILETALKIGADEYIHKPFSLIELDLRLQKLLGKL